MKITKTTLQEIVADPKAFCGFFAGYSQHMMGKARLEPRLVYQRVIEIHGAWINDLQRISENEKNLDKGLDHFKHAGHLAYWVRRQAPVFEATDIQLNISDSPGYDLSDNESALRDLLFAYLNEYLAFDLGFQFCKIHDLGRPGSRAKELVLNEDYIRTMCHFLKYKNVSPHALFLIYKSLFLA